MFVRWVTRVRNRSGILLSRVVDTLNNRIKTDFILIFCLVFVVEVMVYEIVQPEKILENTPIIIGLCVLSFISFIIVIWARYDLENRDNSDGSPGNVVSQTLSKYKSFTVLLLTLLLSSLLAMEIVRIDLEGQVKVETFWDSFTKREVEISVLVTFEPDVDHEWINYTGTILSGIKPLIQFRLPKFPKVSIGDKCLLKGKISPPNSYGDFDFRKYLERKGVYRIMYVKQSNCKSSSDLPFWIKIRAGLAGFKSALIREIDSSLPEPQASLLAGIVFGQSRAFSESFDTAVKSSGVSHVVAASGYNISFVVALVRRLLSFLDRRKRSVVEIVSVWLYCITSGLSPSITRAGLMYSVTQGVSLLGIYIPTLNIMVFSLFLFMLINPRIFFDVGFQLSYAATVGLVYILPALQGYIKKFRLKGFSNSVILPTLACTLATVPITIITFRKVQLLSILVNAVVLPVIDTVLILGVTALGLQYIFVPAAKITFFIIWVQLKYFEAVVSFFGGLTWSVISF